MWKYLIPLDIKMRKIRMEATEVENDWQAVADEDREVAAKGRRSFLRRVEDEESITQEALAVNVYLDVHSNDYGKC